MSFKKEKNMIPIIINNLENKLKLKNKIAIAKELPVNKRRIDIAYAEFEKDFVINYHFKNIFKKLNMNELKVLAFMRHYKIFTIKEIADKLFLDYSDAKNKYFLPFKNLKLISKKSNYKYKISSELVNNSSIIYSIEAKIKFWKEAIKQAEYNKLFSDYSFIAMDDKIINKKRKKILFNCYKKNIGLIKVKKNNNLSIIYKPKKNNDISFGKYYFQQMKIIRDITIGDRKWNLIGSEIYE